MKILVYGEYWPGTMADLLKASLEEFGHEVAILDFTKFLWRNKIIGVPGRALDRLLWKKTAKRINQEFKSLFDLFQPDLVLVSKGVHVFPKTIASMRNPQTVVTNWNPDDFANQLNSNKYLLKALCEYDIIFSARPHLFEEYIGRGAKKCVNLDWYYDPIYHRMVDLKPMWEGVDCRADISFVGSWSQRREEIISSLKGLNIKIWGAHWDKSSSRFKKNFNVTFKVLPSKELPRVILHSKINLNILTQENRDTTNLKLFEITACGGLLVSDRTIESGQILQEGKDAFFYSDTRELRELCEMLLKDDPLRNRVAQSGYVRITKEGHTLSDRTKTLLDAVLHHDTK